MGRSQLPREGADLEQESRSDPDRRFAKPDLSRAAARGPSYQVTSPAPAWTFATRASMKRRSESRLRYMTTSGGISTSR